MTSANPERDVVLAYAPASGQRALSALLALDDALAALLRTTSEAALGQIRLAWWREAIERLDTMPAPAEPVLTAIARDLLPHGIGGAEVATMIDGWEVLVASESLDEAALDRFAAGRGGLFALAGRALGASPTDPLGEAGRGWALGDLAINLGDPGEAAVARARAGPLLDAATAARWSSRARALGAMAHLARRDLALPPGQPPPIGSPRRLGRLLWHRLTGR